MSLKTSITRFFALVQKVANGETVRSENDLSSNLSRVLEELGLSTVIDTSGDPSRKRPDILGYVSSRSADLVLPAEIVLESKKPNEVAAFPDLRTAILGSPIWENKTKPYVKRNLFTVQYFILTTFTHFAAVTITKTIRLGFADVFRGDGDEEALKRLVKDATIEFDFVNAPTDQTRWESWLEEHLRPQSLRPVNFSEIHNSVEIRDRSDFQTFANRLADFAAGLAMDRMTNSGLFESVRSKLPKTYSGLDPKTKRDLHLFLMTQNPGTDLAGIELIAKQHSSSALDDFVAASIHSLISRLFAFKAIEDTFCINEPEPLIEKDYWIFATQKYDGRSAVEIMTLVFESLRSIRNSSAIAIRRFAVYGFFFDWIEQFIDAVVFRSLVQILIAHNFSEVEGDLLGRFFEIYAQKLNQTKRKSLGQYYTPLPIVEFMWKAAMDVARERGRVSDLNVLDPASGSATFLAQGARILFKERIPKFWERLTGFDISAQVSGVAYVNVYIAILSNLSRDAAGDVTDIGLYVTDALDPRNGQYLKQILPLVTEPDYRSYLEQRIRVSSELKRGGTFNLVIGNPPYRNNSARVLSQVAQTFPRLLTSSVQHAGAQLRNIRDDYAWFFAAADFYVGNEGLITFIASDSFTQNLSYRFFREDLLKLYNVRLLLRLGEHVFEDVGPRISFAIVVLEKRNVPIQDLSACEPFPYIDVRKLASDTPVNDLGTSDDPRFVLLRAVAAGEKQLPVPVMHTPLKKFNFSLYPASPVLSRIETDCSPIFEKRQSGLFVEKWPGLITAFDRLFKAPSKEVLECRITTLYELSSKRVPERQMLKSIVAWGKEQRFEDADQDRLEGIARQIRQKGLIFSPAKLKRTLDGAMPNSVRWYPPRSNEVFIYFEPALDIERNENEGKEKGWGSMQQWRDPESHLISPKLIYTTASKPNYGLKAFVVDDEWFVKIHGGTSQQYHYTGLISPHLALRTDGLPNNLTQVGGMLFEILNEFGNATQTFNYFVASIYNSAFSEEFMKFSGSGTSFKIKLPGTKSTARLANELALCGRTMRDVSWLQYLLDGQGPSEATQLENLFKIELLEALALQKISPKQSRRFKNADVYTWSESSSGALAELVADLQERIDVMVENLYS